VGLSKWLKVQEHRLSAPDCVNEELRVDISFADKTAILLD
jgi:hypothetical protein